MEKHRLALYHKVDENVDADVNVGADEYVGVDADVWLILG